MMFAVIFEFQVSAARRQDYLAFAAALRPDVDKLDGFLGIERFENVRDAERMVSFSTWRDEAAMKAAAAGIAVAAGRMNQTACVNTRVVYVESETDDASIDRVIALGKEIHAAFQALPEAISTPALKPNRDLESELQALDLEEELYWVKGDTIRGGVVVSRYSERVDFHEQLNNRVVNLVPMPDLAKVVRWCDDSTQTVGIYPERLRHEYRDALALAGVQHIIALQPRAGQASDDGTEFPGMPHDGIEPMRRMVRWVIDEAPEEVAV